jgi:hypothetical protein
MRTVIALVSAALLLGGCGTTVDPQKIEPLFAQEYPGNYQRMLECLEVGLLRRVDRSSVRSIQLPSQKAGEIWLSAGSLGITTQMATFVVRETEKSRFRFEYWSFSRKMEFEDLMSQCATEAEFA